MDNQQKLTGREQIKATIADASQQLEMLINRRDQLQRGRMEAQNQYKGYYLDTASANAKSKTESAQKNIDRLSADIDNIGSQINALQKTIETDKATLAAFNINVTVAEIIELQDAIKADQKRAANLELLLEEQRLIIHQARQPDNSVVPLKKRRGILSAESIANLDVDHSKALVAIDIEITQAEQSDRDENQAKASSAIKAEETIAGLFDMKRSIDIAITNQRHTLALFMDTLLGQIAAEELDTYQAAAKHLADSLRTLAAIDVLTAKIGVRQQTGILPTMARQAMLPILGDHQDNNKNGLCLHAVTGYAEPEDHKNLLNRLAAQGVEVW